ncbi:MAG TPA: polysaccharide deacetylase family protein [Pyrinomonadaceae bacterium]|jgi:chitin deacetylase|nr:polysaccharide deacetylase family protein [Pyrinomonadaceae bacterium]
MKKLLPFAVALTIAVVGLAVLWRVSGSRTFQFFGRLVPRVNTSRKVVALTFDDGPAPGATDQIISALGGARVRATFFVTGAELERNMDEGRKLVAAGHELGNHSYSHRRMLFVTPSRVRQEVERTDELIRQAGYAGEITFRPPYGKKLFALPYYLSRTGRATVTWDVEPDSYPEVAADSDKIAEHVLTKARPGSIIILHVMYPSRAESLEAVPKIIEGLRARGYDFMTVTELLAAEE